jgi:predicted dienelactone hydrolase
MKRKTLTRLFFLGIFLASCLFSLRHVPVSRAVGQNASAYQPPILYNLSTIQVLQGYTVQNTAENRRLPILVRFSRSVTTPRPVIVWSHGGGPRNDVSLEMNRQWSELLARAGYIMIHPAHIEPDQAALCQKLGVTDPDACRELQAMTWYRPTDARAVLDALPHIVAAFPQLQGRADLTRVAYAGHSFGAFTTMTMAGARLNYVEGYNDISWRHPLPRAFLALSPQGPDRFGFFDESWREIDRPVMTATGAGDNLLGERAIDRREPFKHMPPGDKYELWINSPDAVHGTFNLNDSGPGRQFLDEIAMAGVAFLDAYLSDYEPAKSWLISGSIESLSNGVATLNAK